MKWISKNTLTILIEKKIDNTLYYFYIYNAMKGYINFNINIVKLERETNWEWLQKSDRIIINGFLTTTVD